jgi:hypothetical protein
LIVDPLSNLEETMQAFALLFLFYLSKMKIVHTILTILVCVSFYSCQKSTPLPIIQKNNFDSLEADINGILDIYTSPSYGLRTVPFTSTQDQTLDITGYDTLKRYQLSMYVDTINAIGSSITSGHYFYPTASMDLTLNGQYYTISDTINISSISVPNYLSGTFNGTLVGIYTNDTIVISKGVFNFKFN